MIFWNRSSGSEYILLSSWS